MLKFRLGKSFGKWKNFGCIQSDLSCKLCDTNKIIICQDHSHTKEELLRWLHHKWTISDHICPIEAKRKKEKGEESKSKKTKEESHEKEEPLYKQEDDYPLSNEEYQKSLSHIEKILQKQDMVVKEMEYSEFKQHVTDYYQYFGDPSEQYIVNHSDFEKLVSTTNFKFEVSASKMVVLLLKKEERLQLIGGMAYSYVQDEYNQKYRALNYIEVSKSNRGKGHGNIIMFYLFTPNMPCWISIPDEGPYYVNKFDFELLKDLNNERRRNGIEIVQDIGEGSLVMLKPNTFLRFENVTDMYNYSESESSSEEEFS